MIVLQFVPLDCGVVCCGGCGVVCCDVGVCGPYILFSGLDDINDDEEDGGGVMCDDWRLNIPVTFNRITENMINTILINNADLTGVMFDICMYNIYPCLEPVTKISMPMTMV